MLLKTSLTWIACALNVPWSSFLSADPEWIGLFEDEEDGDKLELLLDFPGVIAEGCSDGEADLSFAFYLQQKNKKYLNSSKTHKELKF